MKDLRHIFFNVGPQGVAAAHDFFSRRALADHAKVIGDGIMAGNSKVGRS